MTAVRSADEYIAITGEPTWMRDHSFGNSSASVSARQGVSPGGVTCRVKCAFTRPSCVFPVGRIARMRAGAHTLRVRAAITSVFTALAGVLGAGLALLSIAARLFGMKSPAPLISKMPQITPTPTGANRNTWVFVNASKNGNMIWSIPNKLFHAHRIRKALVARNAMRELKRNNDLIRKSIPTFSCVHIFMGYDVPTLGVPSDYREPVLPAIWTNATCKSKHCNRKIAPEYIASSRGDSHPAASDFGTGLALDASSRARATRALFASRVGETDAADVDVHDARNAKPCAACCSIAPVSRRCG